MEPEVVLLNNSWQRAWGTMFRRRLGVKLLAFVYPHPAPRLFHTFFCPLLRILALNAAGQVVFDRLVNPRRFVHIPPASIVLEVDPQLVLPPLDQILAALNGCRETMLGALAEGVALDRLLFALLAQAMADLRRVHQVHQWSGRVSLEVLRAKFAFWERGQISTSAGFILDFRDLCLLPRKAVYLARQLLDIEQPYLDELAAASVAGRPWKHDFPDRCLRCADTATWRPAVIAPASLVPEAAWRYDRPENAVPICHRCAYRLHWAEREWLRIELAWSLWGPRFEAFWQWHRAALEDRLPQDWDRQSDPLWPRSFGGPTWENGSGMLKHAAPRLAEDLTRTPERGAALARALNVRACNRAAIQAAVPTMFIARQLLSEKPVRVAGTTALEYLSGKGMIG